MREGGVMSTFFELGLTQTVPGPLPQPQKGLQDSSDLRELKE